MAESTSLANGAPAVMVISGNMLVAWALMEAVNERGWSAHHVHDAASLRHMLQTHDIGCAVMCSVDGAHLSEDLPEILSTLNIPLLPYDAAESPNGLIKNCDESMSYNEADLIGKIAHHLNSNRDSEGAVNRF